MFNCCKHIALATLILALRASAPAVEKKPHGKHRAKVETTGAAILWRDPTNIRSRNLFYGAGGAEHLPPGDFVFDKEDLKGSSPKFDVRDASGVKWKVKLGTEARPETAATRLVWAAGYFVDEDYFVANLHVDDMPAALHRGQEWVDPGGRVRNARLKREPEDRKEIGTWRWRDNPFSGTRELNGLRVLMALINNWDLKDDNNAVFQENGHRTYEIKDQGASFGTNGLERHHLEKKGNLKYFQRSRFIIHIAPNYVNFATPRRACTLCVADLPEFLSRLGERWIGRDIPRDDAHWIGVLLARLSPEQIRDAFRAAGYSPEEIDGFSQAIQARIAELNRL